MDDVAVLLSQARQALLAGRHAPALPLLQEAVNLTPNSCEAHMLLGVCLWLSGEREDGIGEARRATDLNSSSAEAQYNLGMMLQMIGEVEEAALHLEAALALRPEHRKAAEALQSVRAVLPRETPPDVTPSPPPHVEAAREGEVETVGGAGQAAPESGEPVGEVTEQCRGDAPELDREPAADPDWFSTLTTALQSLNPPSDADDPPPEREQTQDESDLSGSPD